MTRSRLAAGLLLTLALGTLGLPLVAQDTEARQFDRRYNIEYNPVAYPHKTPQEGLKAIVKAIDAALAKWESVKTGDLPHLNAELQSAGLGPIELTD